MSTRDEYAARIVRSGEAWSSPADPGGTLPSRVMQEHRTVDGFTFYEEFDAREPDRSLRTVVAVFGEPMITTSGWVSYRAVVAVSPRPNSPVMVSEVSLEFLQTRTKRVDAKRVRRIHPRLLEYIKNGAPAPDSFLEIRKRDRALDRLAVLRGRARAARAAGILT